MAQAAPSSESRGHTRSSSPLKMAEEPKPEHSTDTSLYHPRSRGRPRVRSPESARRFQRECIRQMQATRVYLGTAYQRWRSLSFMFKRTSDMAKHLLDVHERHCTVCYHSTYAALMHNQIRRNSDSVRFFNDIQRAAALRTQLQKPNDPPSSFIPTKQQVADNMSPPEVSTTIVNLPIPDISCFIKQEPKSIAPEANDEAIDLTTETYCPYEKYNHAT